jgi:mannose-6-phosphate isomerase-like protein (cupin superfamily)
MTGRESEMTGKVVNKAEWADAAEAKDHWRGEFEGGAYGANICVIFVRTEKIGDGPRLHRHPYPETFIVRNGRGAVYRRRRNDRCGRRQIVVCPANVPTNSLTSPRPCLSRSITMRLGLFETIWLE